MLRFFVLFLFKKETYILNFDNNHRKWRVQNLICIKWNKTCEIKQAKGF